MRELRDKVAVVTGAASGIGRAMVDRFAAEGMRVVLADVEARALEQAAEEVAARGARVLAVPTDVSNAEAVEILAARTLETFGAVHLLCNNAGVVSAAPFWELPLADWAWVLGVNLWGVIHGCRTFVPRMLAQAGEAHVVNTASMAGLVSSPFNAIYNVAKHGVVTLSETLYFDLLLREAPIGVSVLCPGFVATRIIDADRNRPADTARPAGVPDPDAAAMLEAGRQMLAGGLDPAVVAERVLTAVRENRFWILTHPEMKPLIRARMEDILAERNPQMSTFV